MSLIAVTLPELDEEQTMRLLMNVDSLTRGELETAFQGIKEHVRRLDADAGPHPFTSLERLEWMFWRDLYKLVRAKLIDRRILQ